MSRGFVKEGDQEETPIIPPRAALPDGVPNYVTPNGFKALQDEKEDLLNELANNQEATEQERRIKAAEIDGKLQLLNERINSARVLDVSSQTIEEVKFGAKVTYSIASVHKPVTIQIVGVDEANTKQRKIAFIAPIVKAMIGKKVNDEVTPEMGGERRKIKIIKIEK